MTEKTNQEILDAILGVNNDIRTKVPMKRIGVDFEIKALTPDEVTSLSERATRPGTKGKKNFDDDLFNYLMIEKACVVPNWSEVAKAAGYIDGVDAIKKRLLFGEVAYLLGEINDLNDFDKTDEEQINEIKN